MSDMLQLSEHLL